MGKDERKTDYYIVWAAIKTVAEYPTARPGFKEHFCTCSPWQGNGLKIYSNAPMARQHIAVSRWHTHTHTLEHGGVYRIIKEIAGQFCGSKSLGVSNKTKWEPSRSPINEN